jgi:glycosyltransferase involved in cell wall biosynthesis
LRIALIAPPFVAVPPVIGGGSIQQLIYLISKGLLKLGHDVTVFASLDSKIQAKLMGIELFAKNLFDPDLDDRHVKFAFDHAKEFDILHNHTFLGNGAKYSKFTATPSLTTVHTVPMLGINDSGYRNYKINTNHPLVSISLAQRENFPGINFLSNVPNGIDTDDFAYREAKSDYFLCIGEVNFRKGTHIAIQAAIRTNVSLVIAGSVREGDLPYFSRFIKPFLSSKIIYVGEVSGLEKLKVFQNAKALLAPFLWQEPFGLVLIEAMSCGTPVIAFRNGATSEIVCDGLTGYIVSNIEEMCDSMLGVSKISPYICRKHVKEKFDSDLMIKNYHRLYNNIIKSV